LFADLDNLFVGCFCAVIITCLVLTCQTKVLPVALALLYSLSLSLTNMLLLLGALSVVLLKVTALGLAVQLMARC
jgi:hypothetical protein